MQFMSKDDIRDQLLATNDKIGMQTAIVSHINRNDYEVEVLACDIGFIEEGQHFDLSGTYCSEVIRSNGLVMYEHVGSIESMRLHPVYLALQLESYIGMPLQSPDGTVYGTLNFSSLYVREHGFSAEDRNHLIELKQSIEDAIADGII